MYPVETDRSHLSHDLVLDCWWSAGVPRPDRNRAQRDLVGLAAGHLTSRLRRYPTGGGNIVRNRNPPITPATTSVRSAGAPLSFRRPIKISTTRAIRNPNIGLSTTPPAINTTTPQLEACSCLMPIMSTERSFAM